MANRNTHCLVNCPKCKKEGFLTRRWTRCSGTYFPEVSVYAEPVEEYFYYKLKNKEMPSRLVEHAKRMMQIVRVYKKEKQYFDKENEQHVYKYGCIFDPEGKELLIKPHFIRVKRGESKSITNKEIICQVLRHNWFRKEIRYYVGHYDSNKYKEKLREFKLGKLKNRPNGRTWCLLNNNVSWNRIGSSGPLSSKQLYEKRFA